jgi:hypothetical protein
MSTFSTTLARSRNSWIGVDRPKRLQRLIWRGWLRIPVVDLHHCCHGARPTPAFSRGRLKMRAVPKNTEGREMAIEVVENRWKGF